MENNVDFSLHYCFDTANRVRCRALRRVLGLNLHLVIYHRSGNLGPLREHICVQRDGGRGSQSSWGVHSSHFAFPKQQHHVVTLRNSLKPPLCGKMASWITTARILFQRPLIWDIEPREHEMSGLDQLLFHLCGSHIYHRGQTHKTSPGVEDSSQGIIF